MEHYFTNNPNREQNRRKITFHYLGVEETLISDDGVFSKDTLDFGSRILLETINELDIKGSFLDLGCGIGCIGVLFKKYHPNVDVYMSDINETANQLAKENSELYHQNNTVFLSDRFENITLKFDTIVTNPPIRTGKANIYKMFEESLQHLNEKGTLYIVIRKQQGAESAVKYLKSLASEIKVLNKESGYWIIAVGK